jgi:hypothetical protein
MRVDLTLDERSGKAPTEASRFDAMVVAEGAAAGDRSGCATMQIF